MTRRTYVATFDGADPSFDAGSIKSLVKADEDIRAWWHHIPGVYLIETDIPVGELSRRIKRQSGDVRFLVAEVQLENSNGWLPRRSWRWIRRRKDRAQVSEPTSSTASSAES